VIARPPVKWAGGKTQLLPELRKHVPPRFDRYFEPFVGGGALYFSLAPPEAVLVDSNADLIAAYEAIASSPNLLIRLLRSADEQYAQHGIEFYYRVRDVIPHETPLDRASRLIILNKTCFNGLYRVNKSGKFNVPAGKFKTPPTICDEENIRACSRRLQLASINCGDFEPHVQEAKRGDLCYFDPPYIPTSATADFTSYTADGFGYDDQARLRDCAASLKRRGVTVLLSNSDTPLARRLYDCSPFKVRRVEARRAINSKGGKRGAVGELIIW
jgi:DNA adenine methylase